jgi:hypothetical protein
MATDDLTVCCHIASTSGIGFLADKRIEFTAIVVSIALATTSVYSGIRIHGQRRLLALFGLAGVLIVGGHGLADALWSWKNPPDEEACFVAQASKISALR